jgi:hypothetical protein
MAGKHGYTAAWRNCFGERMEFRFEHGGKASLCHQDLGRKPHRIVRVGTKYAAVQLGRDLAIISREEAQWIGYHLNVAGVKIADLPEWRPGSVRTKVYADFMDAMETMNTAAMGFVGRAMMLGAISLETQLPIPDPLAA